MVIRRLTETTTKTTKDLTNLGVDAAARVEQVVKQTETELNAYIAPVRETVLKRYPTLFAVLVTFGAVSTFLGFEQIILRVQFLQTNPWIIFLFGVTVLFFTGRLYKKLGEL